MSKKKDEEPAREGGVSDNVGSVVIFGSPALIKRLREREERRKAEAENEEREGTATDEAREQGGDEADE